MSVELILWLFSFASVMVLIGLTAHQASPMPPFASLNSSPCDGECGPNLARGRRSSARFRPKAAVISWGFDAEFSQRCCSSRAIHSVEDDLEYDYINPYDSSSRINAVVLIEYALQGALCASFLLTLHWFPFLVMAPVTYYHVKLYLARKHLVDVTEIFRQLSGEKKYRMIKLAFYFCLFIITIYRLVMTAVMLFIDEDINLTCSLQTPGSKEHSWLEPVRPQLNALPPSCEKEDGPVSYSLRS
ncbi:unnamed protein product [Miscanthus lutarioriparius]|uniref:Uncharacterized protein n=1 Tax=Miscanthus lutarioriparius TaxID=422564 RepID=A0A811RJB0_9POAL|nr:unnamed protein product [Miscanthus lutarioriparius]